MMETALLAGVKSLLLPPGACLLPALAALFLRRSRRLAVGLLGVALLSLYGFSTPLVARQMASLLEQRHPALAPGQDLGAAAEVIVVPGCDRYANAPEFGRDEVSACTLERLRYAAVLHGQSGLPLLLSGGSPLGETLPEAELMDHALRTHFGITARWLESRSRNTGENAAFSAAILREAGVRRIVLVTHAVHMPRAVRSFRRHGLTPLPAPTRFYSAPDHRPPWLALMPSAGAMMASALACHELLGLAWYSLSGK